MIKTLLAPRFNSFLGTMLGKKAGKNSRSLKVKIAFAALAVYLTVCFGAFFGMMFYDICEPLCTVGYNWLYFALVSIVSAALCFIGSVFAAQSQLYDAKDNEMLLSMPVAPKYILASRMILLLAINFAFEFIVAVPAVIVYLTVDSFTFVSALFTLVSFLLLPFISLSLSCVFGCIIAFISSRIRRKSLVTTSLSVAFLVMYFYFYTKMNEYIQVLISNGDDVASAVKSVVFPAYYFGTAAANGNVLSLLMFVLCAVIPFAIVYFILSKTFISIATAKRGASKLKYNEKSLKESGVKSALLRRELGRFFAVPTYIVNSALGLIFLVIGALVLLLKKDLLAAVQSELGISETMLFALLIAAVTGIIAMNCITAPSVSLEAKTLWISRSIPVKTVDILMSKVYAHIVICAPPTIFAVTILNIMLAPAPLMRVLGYVVPIVFNVLFALFGLMMNLIFPKLEWASEAVAVKQSMSVFITVFGSMAAVIMMTALYLALSFIPVEVYLILCTVLAAALSVLMYMLIKNRGAVMYESL